MNNRFIKSESPNYILITNSLLAHDSISQLLVDPKHVRLLKKHCATKRIKYLYNRLACLRNAIND